MMGLLDRAGARLTSHPEEADILVVNTCSFIDTAKQESVDTILEMARHKTNGSAKRLIVAGCLVERYRDEIRKTIPEVDAVVGTGELEAILEAAGLAPVHAVAATSPFNILTSVQVDTRTSLDKRSGKESQAGTHKHSQANHESRSEQELSGSEQAVSGHDFSRAERGHKNNGALAPEANASVKGTGFSCRVSRGCLHRDRIWPC
jgi:ribosomal protein S12 methylthiotransferase